jgi:predicted ATPase
LVGRQEEMAMLMRRWQRARQGDGQLVLIVGEPGIGKSRLIEDSHARLREIPHNWVEWSCSQLLQNTPLHPITETGRQRFGGADVPAERRLAELDSSLAQVRDRRLAVNGSDGVHAAVFVISGQVLRGARQI